jgi:predicted transposase YdaD
MANTVHNPFDVVMKRMVETNPLGMLRFLGLDGQSAEPFDAEMSTISPRADYVLRVAGPDYLAHIEFESSYKSDNGRRMLLYGALAHYTHVLPVKSVLVLLREEANGPAITGAVTYGDNVYNYHVVRLWEVSPEAVLAGPTALLPLLPLTKLDPDGLPRMLSRLDERFTQEEAAGDLWTETKLLMGLKFAPEHTDQLLKGVIKKMKDSSTYQAILEEGRIEGERRTFLRVGTRRFGAPDARTQAAVDAISSQEELDRLTDRLFEVESWDDLLR